MDDMNYKNKDDSIWGKRGIRTKSYAKPKSLFLYDLQDFIINMSGVLIS